LTNGFGGTVNNVAGECDCLTISNPGQPRERTYGYDANRNLTSITGTNTPWYSQTFEYDQLNRLTSAAGRYGTISYTYDDVGNRHTRDTNETVENYTYFTGTNRLQQVTGGQNPRTFAYDSNGNITGDGTLNFIYDQNNQLIEVEQGANSIAEYAYNGLGQRVIKQAGANTTVYHYDLDGQLIAESLLDGTMTREYLYMGKVRVAMVDVAGGNALYHYLNDRLGTPEILTDATGTVAWEAWYEPFGEAHIHPSSSVVNNIRLPGQYYDSETGLHYNYFRYYDPRTGRYLTPDPIGLRGGANLYLYASVNPTNMLDPLGLFTLENTLKVLQRTPAGRRTYAAIMQRQPIITELTAGVREVYGQPDYIAGLRVGQNIYIYGYSKDMVEVSDVEAAIILVHEVDHLINPANYRTDWEKFQSELRAFQAEIQFYRELKSNPCENSNTVKVYRGEYFSAMSEEQLMIWIMTRFNLYLR
jgi:RHS repeat-associated protein